VLPFDASLCCAAKRPCCSPSGRVAALRWAVLPRLERDCQRQRPRRRARPWVPAAQRGVRTPPSAAAPAAPAPAPGPAGAARSWRLRSMAPGRAFRREAPVSSTGEGEGTPTRPKLRMPGIIRRGRDRERLRRGWGSRGMKAGAGARQWLWAGLRSPCLLLGLARTGCLSEAALGPYPSMGRPLVGGSRSSAEWSGAEKGDACEGKRGK